MPTQKSFKRIVLSALSIVLLIGVSYFAFTLLKNVKETQREGDYLRMNASSILRSRFSNGPNEESKTLIWPERIFENHPNATHVSGVTVYNAYFALNYLSFAIKDQKGWHSYTFQVSHKKLFNAGETLPPIAVDDPQKKQDLESGQVSLKD